MLSAPLPLLAQEDPVCTHVLRSLPRLFPEAHDCAGALACNYLLSLYPSSTTVGVSLRLRQEAQGLPVPFGEGERLGRVVSAFAHQR
eukprot:1190998-Prorocentrum_minimum.AAC.1